MRTRVAGVFITVAMVLSAVVATAGVGTASPSGVIFYGASPGSGIAGTSPTGDGHGPVHSAGSSLHMPQAVSPDGNEVLYLYGRNGVNALRVVGTDGRGDRQLVPAEAMSFATWSADGWIHYGDNYPVRVVKRFRADDPAWWENTETICCDVDQFSPIHGGIALSPNGDRVAFIAGNPAGGWAVWVADATYRNGRVVAPLPGNGGSHRLSWSAAGDRIVFDWRTEPEGPQPGWWECAWQSSLDIWVVGSDGSGLTNLTRTGGLDYVDEFTPVVSPDGTQIAFASKGAERCEAGTMVAEQGDDAKDVWVMDIDGSDRRKVASHEAVGYQAFGAEHLAWQRCGAATRDCTWPTTGSPTPAPSPTSSPTPPPSPTDPPPATPSGRDVSATCDGVDPAVSFTDIDRNVHRPMIECLSGWSITQGKGGGVYGAKDPLTRGQVATFLVSTLESAGWAVPPGDGACAGPVHGDNLDALVAAGIMGRGGCELSVQMTRSAMAQAVAGALRWSGSSPPSEPRDHFVDDAHLPASVQAEHDLLAQLGIVTGTGPGTFAPDDLLRRDQMATFLARLLDVALYG